MNELALGWVETTLGELFDITSSRRVHQHEWTSEGVPFYRAREIKKLARSGSVDNDLYISEELFEKHSSQFGAPTSGDLMVTAVGTLGECYKVKEGDRFYFKDASVLWLRKKSGVNTEYIAKMFLSNLILEQVHGGGGTTVGTYTVGDAKETVVALPPVSEQRRIVAKIDSLTGKSRRARDHLDRIPRLVEKYKQAVLAAAFRGDLTGASTVASRHKLGAIALKITKGASPKWQGFEYQTEGVLFIRSQNVGWGYLLLDEKAFLPTDYNLKQKNSVIAENDVLLNIVGASIGRTAVATGALVGANCNQAVAVIRLVEPTFSDARYLNLWLQTGEAQSAITLGSVDVARANFSLSSIAELQLPWPEESHRREIVWRVEVALSWIERIASEATSARSLINRLDQTVLAKAFRGELVPQDPDDEPASVLLDRINAERSQTSKTGHGRRKAAAS